MLYSYRVPDSKISPDYTSILKSSTHPNDLVHDLEEPCETSWNLFMHGYNKGPSRNCLGYREKDPVTGALGNTFIFKSYNDVKTEALALGSYMLQKSIIERTEYTEEKYEPARSLRLLGIFSKNCFEWFVSEQAANAYNFTLVPLYDSFGEEMLLHILNETRMKTVACSLECLPLLLTSIQKTGFVKHILLFKQPHEKVPENIHSLCESAGIKTLDYYQDIINSSSSQNIEPISFGKADDLNTICYTSGTVSKGKGVILTHRNMVSCIAGLIRGPVKTHFLLSESDVALSYLPLAHVLERAVCNLLFYLGASAGIYSQDTTKLLEDVGVLNPTVFVSVPRLFYRIHDAIIQSVAEKSRISQFLFNFGKNEKLQKLRQSSCPTSVFWDSLVFNQTKKLLGNRLRYMVYGGAPLDASVQELIEVFFCVPLLAGYGLTETMGPALLSSAFDGVCGHVGEPLPCVEFRLQSYKEMGYSVDDALPRGELLCRGPSITPGYFFNEKETNLVIDKDGWFHTGDIGVLFDNGCIKIIDRKKNIFKLSHGEYITPDRIEAMYSSDPCVSQIFVYGHSEKNHLVAIVVPEKDALIALAAKNRITTNSVEELYFSIPFKKKFLQVLDATAKESGLKGFEKIKNVHFEPNPFTIENNLLTPTFKLKRIVAARLYEKEIENMYQNPL